MSIAADGRVIPPAPEVSDSRTFRRAFADLQEGLYSSELWLHRGWTDIKQRYRRSLLGPLWITVATGVTGEPTAPGRFNGGAVSRKRLRPLAASQRASAPRYHISPIGMPSLKMQWWCKGSAAQQALGFWVG